MLKELLYTKKGIFRVSLLMILTLLLTDVVGLLRPFEIILTARIEESPLPKVYFPIFILLGLLIPLIIKFKNIKNNRINLVISPYLYLLLAQILTELFFVVIIGKGMGVIIGLLFSSLRIVQLRYFWILINNRINLKILVVIQLILWSVNIIQIF